MKKKLSAITLLLSSFIIFSCNKHVDQHSTSRVAIDATVASGSVYELNLSTYGSRASIMKQATNYSTSEISSTTAEPVYKFSYTTKTAVSDEVVIAVVKSSSGSRCRQSNDSTIVTVNLKVQ